MSETFASDEATQVTRGIEGGVGRNRLPAGTVMGRYVVLGRLGTGGMGVVYAAYDPELDRKVALKLLHAEVAGAGGRTRLLREAQALAKLSHPNVVAIHDVGTAGDDVWIAMEFVVGRTLTDWLRERKRSWREVLAVIRPAAAGLAAAHAAGLVHRDIKPDNVMLDSERGADGSRRAPPRVRVMDFGLARGSGPDDDSAAHDADANASRKVRLDDVVTRAGAILGTPAYMAPEQFRGHNDARSDQFSLCVMLWEALWEQRPFSGASMVELGSNICEGRIRSPPRRGGVPRWLRRIVLRGLEVDPQRRWGSIEALLAALDRNRKAARVRRAAVAVAVVGMIGAGAALFGRLDEERRVAACDEAGAELRNLWSDDAAAEARAGLLATGGGHAETTADKLAPWLAAQADAIADARTQACRNAEVERTWDAGLAERAAWCIDERREELAALVTELTSADERAVTHAVEAAAGLRRVDPCLDASLLARLPAPPIADRDEVIAVQRELSRARALEATGGYEKGLQLARESLARAETLAWPPLIATARLQAGELMNKTGDYAEAESMLAAAYFEAARADAAEDAFAAATVLTRVSGQRLAHYAEGERWAQHAEVMRLHLDDSARLREARQLANLGLLLYEKGDYAESEALQKQALAIWEASLGAEHPEVATSLVNLGNIDLKLRNLARARARTERALRLRERALGPDHPYVAATLDQLAGIRWAAGDNDAALALSEEALRINEAALGPDHPDVAGNLNNLATVLWRRGERARAKALFERALASAEATMPEDHPDVGDRLNNLAVVHMKLGEYEQSQALHERALAIRETALGPDHADTAQTLSNLGDVLAARKSFDEAKRVYTRALAIGEQALGPDHVDTVQPMLGLVRIAVQQGQAGSALALAEQAVQIYEKADASANALAHARFHLAWVLADSGVDPGRAVALAEQAREGYREAGETSEVANIDGWLAERSVR